MVWTFLFATCLAYTNWHNFQRIMRLTLCAACFTCFTSWRCHFIILLYLDLLYSILLFPKCKEKLFLGWISNPRKFFLYIQQLLVFATFACNFFSTFFFFGDFTNTADICTCSNWNQTTYDQVFVNTDQFIG